MAEQTFEKKNYIEIIGTLKDVNLTERTDRNANDYISGTITVESIVDGITNTFDVSLYAKKVTKAGSESKLYANYAELKQQIGQKIRVSGDLREDRYFNKTTNLLTSAQRIEGRFINVEKNDTPDKAIFDFSGFVMKPLEAKLNKDKQVYTYEMSIGQANYNDTQLNVFKFNVDPENKPIITAITNLYKINNTIHFGGNLSYIEKQTEVKAEAAFGEAATRVFTNTLRNYFITWGNQPITSMDQGMYDMNTIIKLQQDYNTRDTELVAENQNNVNAFGGTSATISSRQSSLI